MGTGQPCPPPHSNCASPGPICLNVFYLRIFVNFPRTLPPNGWRQRCANETVCHGQCGFVFACRVICLSTNRAAIPIECQIHFDICVRWTPAFSRLRINRMNQHIEFRMTTAATQCTEPESNGSTMSIQIYVSYVQQTVLRSKYDIRMKSEINLRDHIEAMGENRMQYLFTFRYIFSRQFISIVDIPDESACFEYTHAQRTRTDTHVGMCVYWSNADTMKCVQYVWDSIRFGRQRRMAPFELNWRIFIPFFLWRT